LDLKGMIAYHNAKLSQDCPVSKSIGIFLMISHAIARIAQSIKPNCFFKTNRQLYKKFNKFALSR